MLTAAGLQWVADAIGTAAVVVSVEPLGGATSAALYRIDVVQGGVTHALVLRLFTNAAWLAEEPDLPRHEAAALRVMQAADLLPVPEVVAVDDTGAACGVPALLMTRLPGTVDLSPVDMDGWLVGLAEALVQIHAVTVDPAAFPWRFMPYAPPDGLRVPAWSDRPDPWARAIAILQRERPSFAARFIHRDYHPVNVLWSGGTLSGVIDWPNACLGPVGEDVGRCRGNLASLYGVDVADRFLTAYESAAGAAFTYAPYWDLASLADMMLVDEEPPGVYPGWVDFGVTGLTDDLIRQRVAVYLDSLLARG
jgi:aminoglycoside phosphotransferase (APT) family kinase protein